MRNGKQIENKETQIYLDGDTGAKTQSQINFKEVAATVAASATSRGWERVSAGETASIDYNYRFDLYKRKRNLAFLMEQKKYNQSYDFPKISLETSHDGTLKKVKKIKESGQFLGMVSKEHMGDQYESVTPSTLLPVISGSESLPVLSDFMSYPSLASVRSGKPALMIAYDSEWYYPTDDMGERVVLTWQFSVVSGENLIEYIFLRKTEKYALTMELAIGRILDSLGLVPTDMHKVRRYEIITGLNSGTGKPETALYLNKVDAIQHSDRPYPDGKAVRCLADWSDIKHIPVVILCHAGKADISAFGQRDTKYVKTQAKTGKFKKYGCRNYFTGTSEVQGGIVTLNPIGFYPQSVNPKYARNRNTYVYPITLSLRDTMCHAPGKAKSLNVLGDTVGWEKIQLDDGCIDHMDRLLADDPCAYFEYAANDSDVTLLYESALYGYNCLPSVTLMADAAKIMKEAMMNYLHCDKSIEFDYKYRGLKKVSHGLSPRDDRPGYTETTSMEPISDKANTIQYYASQAYHGGYNGSSDIGYFPQTTFDYDLQNAYPTAMCLVPDIDWQNPYKVEINNRELTLQDFVVPIIGGYAPLMMLLAYVRFDFPSDVKYPCIPIHVDGNIIFPQTSQGLNGVYACGPELYLALMLGAKIFVERGYILNSIINPDTGQISYSMRAAVKQFIEDRRKAKADHGKGSLEDQVLKEMVCGTYGKTAQGVIDKQSWNTYLKEMQTRGCSGVTNPVSAAMITSIVRAELLATINQSVKLGYMTCSVTTDGFISDISEGTLKSLDMYGLRPFMEQARLYLTNGNDPEVWEIKHCQDDLVNFTTRGNISCHDVDHPMYYKGKAYEGVCAHNGTRSGFVPDSYEDRLWVMRNVLSRKGPVAYTCKEWTSFKDLSEGKPFSVRNIKKHIRMDYDMKRKPDRDSFFTSIVTVEGNEYEIANFSTMPFQTIAEYEVYRSRKKLVACLRTMDDWSLFWFKIDAKDSGVKVRDKEWAVLNSCIMGHRAGFWTVPKLKELKGAERDAWINSHNNSAKKWTSNDWKNAGRNSRQTSMLPKEMLSEKLSELMED